MVSCEGLCVDLRYYHARCVGLTYGEGCACLHQNIFWMCDSCRKAIEHVRFRESFNEKQDNSYARKSEIDNFKAEVQRISKTLSQMAITKATVPNEYTLSEHPNSGIEARSSSFSSTKLNSIDPEESITDNANLQLYVSIFFPDVCHRTGRV